MVLVCQRLVASSVCRQFSSGISHLHIGHCHCASLQRCFVTPARLAPSVRRVKGSMAAPDHQPFLNGKGPEDGVTFTHIPHPDWQPGKKQPNPWNSTKMVGAAASGPLAAPVTCFMRPAQRQDFTLVLTAQQCAVLSFVGRCLLNHIPIDCSKLPLVVVLRSNFDARGSPPRRCRWIPRR
jgi:hypothetical protein